MSNKEHEQRILEAEICRTVSAAEDGVIEEAQRVRLNEVLEKDATARSFYLDLIALRVTLMSAAGHLVRRQAEDSFAELAYLLPSDAKHGNESVQQQSAYDSYSTLHPSRQEQKSQKYRMATRLACVSAAVLVVSAGFLWRTQDAAPVAVVNDGDVTSPNVLSNLALQPSVAQVSDVSIGATWTDPNQSLSIESSLRAGQNIKLSEGEVEITYLSGVRLRLLGPANYRLRTEGGILLRGGLIASVPEAGQGFTVETPNGKVVDLGTEFGVVVDDFGYSEVGVFKGKVEAYPVSNATKRQVPSQKLELLEGDGLLWTETSLSRIETDARRFSTDRLASQNRNAFRHARLGQESPSSDMQWQILGTAEPIENGFLLQGSDATNQRSFMVSQQEFDPSDGPISVRCEVTIQSLPHGRFPSMSIHTRSDNQRGGADAPWDDMLATCMRCCFSADPHSGDGLLDASTKHESGWTPVGLSWRGFRKPVPSERYLLRMVDDGVNVSFTVAMASNPAISKTVHCRSLFRGDRNFVAIEGPKSGSIAVENIWIFQENSSTDEPQLWSSSDQLAASPNSPRAKRAYLDLLPSDAELLLNDSFDGNSLDNSRWSTLGTSIVVDGRLQLGESIRDVTINTWRSRPYLITKEKFSVKNGPLTVVGKAEFADNYLSGYGGSFAVMTRSTNTYRGGGGWERSLLSKGIRSNFWPVGLEIGRSLEIHSVEPDGWADLLESASLQIVPEVRTYFFKVVDDGESVQLTIVDADDPERSGKISHKIEAGESDTGYVGIESTWGCPVILDDIRIYQSRPAK